MQAAIADFKKEKAGVTMWPYYVGAINVKNESLFFFVKKPMEFAIPHKAICPLEKGLWYVYWESVYGLKMLTIEHQSFNRELDLSFHTQLNTREYGDEFTFGLKISQNSSFSVADFQNEKIVPVRFDTEEVASWGKSDMTGIPELSYLYVQTEKKCIAARIAILG
jgi:hypothetical protein